VSEGAETLHSPIDVPRLARIYDRTAAFYDQVVAQQQSGPKLAALEVLARKAGERFLEVGVGTGWAFAPLVNASGVERAIGIDVAPGMLEVARERLQGECALTYAPLILADGLRLPFADGSFDCILCSYTLEVLPGEAMLPALREWRRVLRSRGRLVEVNLTDGEGDDDEAMTADWRRRFPDDPEYFGGARPVHAMELLRHAGFVEVTRRYVGPAWPSEVLLGIAP
jgi:ubiquinone/menaquinone biosynthesis C-methylase UbiE